jgi:hypothetical protein
MYKLPLRPTPVGIESLQGLPLAALGVPGTQALPLRIRGPTRAYARLRARADSCPVRMAPASIAALEEELRALDLEALRERADSEGVDEDLIDDACAGSEPKQKLISLTVQVVQHLQQLDALPKVLKAASRFHRPLGSSAHRAEATPAPQQQQHERQPAPQPQQQHERQPAAQPQPQPQPQSQPQPQPEPEPEPAPDRILEDCCTPLQNAIYAGDHAAMRRLLDQGHAVNGVNAGTRSERVYGPPLFVACGHCPSAIQDLVDRGANLTGKATDEAWTALHAAAFHGNVEGALTVVRMAPSLRLVRDRRGRTPADVALAYKHASLASTLLMSPVCEPQPAAEQTGLRRRERSQGGAQALAHGVSAAKEAAAAAAADRNRWPAVGFVASVLVCYWYGFESTAQSKLVKSGTQQADSSTKDTADSASAQLPQAMELGESGRVQDLLNSLVEAQAKTQGQVEQAREAAEAAAGKATLIAVALGLVTVVLCVAVAGLRQQPQKQEPQPEPAPATATPSASQLQLHQLRANSSSPISPESSVSDFDRKLRELASRDGRGLLGQVLDEANRKQDQ